MAARQIAGMQETEARETLESVMLEKWAGRFRGRQPFPYGDELSYRKAAQFLSGCGLVEDWGCGTGWARRYFDRYRGIDGTAGHADAVCDLRDYRSTADCIHIRHVLEHNVDWQLILDNAIHSFVRRLVVTVFTPFADRTQIIGITPDGIPDIALGYSDLCSRFGPFIDCEERFASATFYGAETMFYVTKPDAHRL
jgi:hypothetical protein